MKHSIRSITSTALAAALAIALTACAFPRRQPDPGQADVHRGRPSPQGDRRAGFQQGSQRRNRLARQRCRPHRRGSRENQVIGTQGRDRHAHGRRRLVAGSDQWPQFRVRALGYRGRRHHRRQVRPENPGRGPADGDGQEAGHHRVAAHRPGCHRCGLP